MVACDEQRTNMYKVGAWQKQTKRKIHIEVDVQLQCKVCDV